MTYGKKKLYYYCLILILFFFVGFFFFLLYRDILVIRFFWSKKRDLTEDFRVISKKDVNFFYFKDNKFKYETKKLVWFSNKEKLIKHIVNNWLLFLKEEGFISNTVCLVSVAFDKHEQQVFFSFDRFPLERSWSIYKKWNFVESLFKTIRESGLNINFVFFLVNNKPMVDDHLDFSTPWPVSGFY